MKIYGYEKDNDNMIELNEVSIMSSISEMEQFIEFLKFAVESHSSVENSSELCHSHLRDWDENWINGQPDVIVVTEFKKTK